MEKDIEKIVLKDDKLDIPNNDEDIHYSDPQEIVIDLDEMKKNISQNINYKHPLQVP